MKKAFLAFTVLSLAGSALLQSERPHAQDASSRSGEEIYNDKCVYCHSRRGWGTRVLSRRVPEGQAELTERALLPAAFTAAVVRQGIGSMPAFTPTDLSDEEIAVVAQWLEPGS